MELYGVLPPGPKLSTTLPLSTPLGFFAPPTSQISPLTTTAPNLCRGIGIERLADAIRRALDATHPGSRQRRG
jgi:hypothetical protein